MESGGCIGKSDIGIIGPGLSGLRAALEASRSGMNITVFGDVHQSHYYTNALTLDEDQKVLESCGIELDGIKDTKGLLEGYESHLREKGVGFVPGDVCNISVDNELFNVHIFEDGYFIHKAIVLAVGPIPQYMLEIPQE